MLLRNKLGVPQLESYFLGFPCCHEGFSYAQKVNLGLGHVQLVLQYHEKAGLAPGWWLLRHGRHKLMLELRCAGMPWASLWCCICRVTVAEAPIKWWPSGTMALSEPVVLLLMQFW